MSHAVPKPHTLSRRDGLSILAVLIAVFAVILQSRITGVGLRDMQGALGLGPDETVWVNTVFTMCEVLVIPFVIRVAAQHSIRALFVPATCAFACASLLALGVDTLGELLVVRAIQGFACGCIIPLATAIFGRTLPHYERLAAFAIYGSVVMLPLSLAPLLEALSLDVGTFRLIFVPAAVLAGCACLLGARTLPTRDVHERSTRLVDPLGLALPAIGAALVVLATEQGNRLNWFDAPWVRGVGLAGLLVLVAAWMHLRSQPQPALRLEVLRHRNFRVGLVTFLFFRISLLAVAWAVPDFLIRIAQLRPQEFAQLFLVMLVPQLAIPVLVHRYVRKLDLRLVMAAALALQAAGCFRAFGLDSNWSVAELAQALFLHALGQGLYYTPNLAATALNIEPDQRTTAGTFMHFARIVGGSLGASVVGTLFTRAEQVHQMFLNEYLTTGNAHALSRVEGLAQQLAGRVPGDAFRSALSLIHGSVQRQAYVLAYSDVFAGIGVLMLVAVLWQLRLRHIRLDELEPQHGNGRL